MIIVFPIGGRGSRFLQEGFDTSKPLIKVFNKCIMRYLVERLSVDEEKDEVYVIYFSGVSDYINGPVALTKSDLVEGVFHDLSWQHKVHYLPITTVTTGVLETLQLGFENVELDGTQPVVILDCDIFYLVDILEQVRATHTNKNYLFYFHDDGDVPEYSYLEFFGNNDVEMSRVRDIHEKHRVTPFANSGVYVFQDWSTIQANLDPCLCDSKSRGKEPYLSELVRRVIQHGHDFYGLELNAQDIINLGTPERVAWYKKSRPSLLFDLDGTLVVSDEAYLEVWKAILGRFHVDLSSSIYEKCIQGQSDIVVKNRFSLPIPVETLSRQKDSLFQGLIEKVQIVEGTMDFLNRAFQEGIPIVVVTNCNRQSAEQIMEYFGLTRFIHGLVIGNECCNPKPSADPYYYAIEKILGTHSQQCIILEDSKTGLLSASSCNVRLIIGMETTYPAKELLDLGCDMTLKTFTDSYESVMRAYNESHKKGLTSQSDGYLNSVVDALYEKFPNYAIQLSDYKLKGGFISDVISLTILPHFNYVLKLENQSDNPIKVMAEQLNLYDTEYYFYTNIAPFLSVAEVQVPTSFGVIQKGQNIRGIVLENMYSKGYIIHGTLDHKTLFGVATAFIWTLSRLHISFWGADLKSLFPGLKTPMDHEFSWGDFIQTRWNVFHEKWGFMMTESILETCKYIVDNFYDIEEYMCKGDNRTLCHGDFKAPNIFYHPETTKCCLIDWQYVTFGKGAQDLVFFMIESFETDSMTSAFKEYLLSYYYLLVAQEHPEYDHEQFRRDVRMSAFYFPFFVAIWFGTMDQDSLLDKNFPFFFIQRLFHFYNLL